MIIKVNDKEKNFENDTLSVSGLLKISDVDRPEIVTVQRNGEFVQKENYDTTYLAENDSVDFLYFMGGGSN